MSVSIYTGFIDKSILTKKLLKSVKKPNLKRSKDEVIKSYMQNFQMIYENNKSIDPSKASLCAYNMFRICDDYAWHMDGKKVIFPNDDLLESAWKANFDLGKVTEGSRFISTPFRNFSIAIPTHMKFDGEVLPSPMVGFYRYNASEKGQIIEDFRNKFDISVPMNIDPDAIYFGENILYIQYQSNINKDMFQCLQVPESNIPFVLASNTVEEYLSRVQVDDIDNTASGLATTPEEARIQFKLMKLTVSLMVFYCVQPSSITEGIGKYKSKSTPKYHSNPMQYQKFALTGETASSRSSDRKNVMHLRRLVAERYYTKDEYKNQERGTRWIVCGADKTPFTQELR